ncbi:DHHA1 domain-containing protein [Thermoanaerobacterium sp. RBIITD]|uniref:alanyl-tRNA editing protein n=1 Tax=Thermoanaerobacterium sp. RBIITD TaxID=1550240 RepID=UPI000BB7B63D|nr:DHHA1 domain-containing protein [Thermoanaerobacterium sp. RBIITD]SNX55201.1 alanyl-tRNA synthetase [Thermoanaerobacterium sp. RBIITD]
MQKLYYYDSYTKDFTANVVDIRKINGYYEVILDKTYFYPESGGQTADHGTIDGLKVENVILRDDDVIHILKECPHNKTVSCLIDWNRRFDNMQQHTGQHLLSAVFNKLYDAETESFNIGDMFSHITILNDKLSEKDIEKVEEETNKIIYLNLPVITYFVDNEKLNELPLRKEPKISNNIRIVEIKEFDYSPCGGTHVKNLGEIGIIKIRKWEKVKDGIRVEFVCGLRAVKDFINKNNYINRLTNILSIQESGVINSVNKLTLENKELKKELNKLKDNILSYEAEKLLDKSINLNKYRLIVKTYENRKIKELRTLSQIIAKGRGMIAILSNVSENVDIIISRSDDVNININSFFKEILDVIDGKGGGSPKSCQGSGKLKENLNIAIDKAVNMISKESMK